MSRKRLWLLRLASAWRASACKRAVIRGLGSCLICFMGTPRIMTFRWIVLRSATLPKRFVACYSNAAASGQAATAT